MNDRKERRFLLLAGLLVLAAWLVVGWGLRAKGHLLYTSECAEVTVLGRVRHAGGPLYRVQFRSGQTAEVEIPDRVVHALPPVGEEGADLAAPLPGRD
jgi:hypothetical protein